MSSPNKSGTATTPSDQGMIGRAREIVVTGTAKARIAGERHASIAVPFRAVERNRAVAASVLAGGVAYRLFLWLLPFALIVGGALGLGNAQSIQEAVAKGGLPAALVNGIGDAARAANTNWWWLLAAGIPLLLWEGYAGTRALQLIHALVWNEPPPRTRPLAGALYFSAGMCAFVALVSLTWWLRHSAQLVQIPALVLMAVPIGGLWLLISLHLPHRSASWKALLPGAFLVGVGFQVVHGLVVYLLGPKLDKATSLYGGLGIATTLLFFMWIVGWIIVTAPILNSALDDVSANRGSISPLPPPHADAANALGAASAHPAGSATRNGEKGRSPAAVG